MTQAEDIPDFHGLKAVYSAYASTETFDKNLRLPGLEKYTDKQLFFLAFASVSIDHYFNFTTSVLRSLNRASVFSTCALRSRIATHVIDSVELRYYDFSAIKHS